MSYYSKLNTSNERINLEYPKEMQQLLIRNTLLIMVKKFRAPNCLYYRITFTHGKMYRPIADCFIYENKNQYSFNMNCYHSEQELIDIIKFSNYVRNLVKPLNAEQLKAAEQLFKEVQENE